MDTAICIHCGARALVKRDARNEIVAQRCVNGHPFEFDKIERTQSAAEKRAKQELASGN